MFNGSLLCLGSKTTKTEEAKIVPDQYTNCAWVGLKTRPFKSSSLGALEKLLLSDMYPKQVFSMVMCFPNCVKLYYCVSCGFHSKVFWNQSPEIQKHWTSPPLFYLLMLYHNLQSLCKEVALYGQKKKNILWETQAPENPWSAAPTQTSNN